MQSRNELAGFSAHTSPEPHAVGAVVGAHARAFVVHVEGGTSGVCAVGAQLPPEGPSGVYTQLPVQAP